MARMKDQKNVELVSSLEKQDFRKFANSFAQEFTLEKDRVFALLGKHANYESGTYREILLRDFLSKLLPNAVSVDTGFIYGCEKVANSKQMDIIIWNSSAYPSIFRSSYFVIVPPEAVIAVISVKSTLNKKYLKEALDNVSSVLPLEYNFRFSDTGEQQSLPAIRKYLVFFEKTSSVDTVFNTVQDFYSKLLLHDDMLRHKDRLVRSLRGYTLGASRADSLNEAYSTSRRIFLSSIATINVKADTNFMMFPRENSLNGGLADPPLLPSLWRQASEITTSFEKLVFDILQTVCIAIGTRGWGSIHKWIGQDPQSINRHNTEELTQDNRTLFPCP